MIYFALPIISVSQIPNLNVFLSFAKTIKLKWHLIVLICISRIIVEVLHLFICFQAICIFIFGYFLFFFLKFLLIFSDSLFFSYQLSSHVFLFLCVLEKSIPSWLLNVSLILSFDFIFSTFLYMKVFNLYIVKFVSLVLYSFWPLLISIIHFTWSTYSLIIWVL